jgi:hypothetical protein
MAQVLNSGGGVFNTDPTKVPRYVISAGLFDYVYQGSNTNVSAGGFWTTNTIGAIITTAQVANTARTVVNISNKGGFLIWGIGTQHNSSSHTNTWVITVDGIATTLPVYSISDSGAGRACFGAFSSKNNNNGNETVNFNGYNVGHSPLDSGRLALSYSSNNNLHRYVMDPLVAISTQPTAIIRFETSLTVTFASSLAISSSVDSYVGVQYILDS